jgi:four helix bundle protein
MKSNVVREKSYGFALKAVRVYKELARKETVLSRQMLRAATSVGANVEEALAGQSRADFISKMSIASKEAREANYWLRLLKDSGYVESAGVGSLLRESDEMLRLLTSIVKTSMQRTEKR